MSTLRTNEIESLDGLSNATVEDLATINNRTVSSDSVSEGLSTSMFSHGQQVSVSGWQPGAYAFSNPRTGGGGLFVADAGRSKSEHDGGLFISPTVPKLSDQPGATYEERRDNFLAGLGETDPGGSGVFVRQLDGPIDVRMFGAVGDYDGITGTVNTAAIQAAIDASGLVVDSGSGIRTIGAQNRVTISDGTYLTETLYIDKFYVELVGIGFACLTATDSVTNTSFILEVGTPTRNAGARAEGCKIRNIRFGRVNSNPYQQTYDSATFGSGATYQFQQSCGGIKIVRSHSMSVLEDCTFVGLRLAVHMVGAYLFNIKGCHFGYNDRHIHARKNNVDNISNNDQVIDGCIFGASIMNGGVWLSGMDGIRISNFDFENASQLPFYFYQCRGLYMEHLYFENNNKYFNDPAVPAYVYEPTPFDDLINDAVPQAYAGFDMANFAGQLFVARNYLSSNATVPLRGAFLSISPQITPRFEDVKLTQSLGSGEYYFQDYSSSDNGFDLTNVQTIFPQKLLSNTTPAVVRGNRKGGDEAINVPETWYVDFDNGNDDINIGDMSTTNRLKTLNLRAIPEDDAHVYTAYVTGTTTTILLPPVHRNAKVRVIGETNPSIGSLQLHPGANFDLSDCTMTIIKPASVVGQDNGPMRIDARLTSVTSVFDEAAGFLQFMTDSKFYMDGVNITQNNAAGYTSIVSDGTEVWLKDCTVNKDFEARNFGKIYYFNLTGPIPTVGANRAGKVEAL